ncbi:MAG: histidine--tRNA ligase [Wenzhouxiangella sp.]
MQSIHSIRGMHDILPDATPTWRWLENQLAALFDAYDFREIRIPLVEKAELFSRAIGQATDVVEKEMYAFADRNGDVLSLRPEGTAGVVRAAIQHGLLNSPGLKVWYRGPMFRHERPQRGRQRQFHQFGAEVFGLAGPDVDAELIALGERIWHRLGLDRGVRLEINTLGDPQDRQRYRARLIEYLEPYTADLDADSQRRLTTNPLRIFDSKHPQTQAIMAGAPRLAETLGPEAREHFEQVCAILDGLGIGYRINPGLVRGLDYYCRTVFEWITDELGAQGTVCAGGRYDGLVGVQGGKDTPGIGFALGVERLVELLAHHGAERSQAPQVYLVCQAAALDGLRLAEELRDKLPALRLATHLGGGSFKAQFKRADRSGARYALVLGEAEIASGVCQIKDLRGTAPQETLPREAIAGRIGQLLPGVDAV